MSSKQDRSKLRDFPSVASWYPVRCEWFRPNDTYAQLTGIKYDEYFDATWMSRKLYMFSVRCNSWGCVFVLEILPLATYMFIICSNQTYAVLECLSICEKHAKQPRINQVSSSLFLQPTINQVSSNLSLNGWFNVIEPYFQTNCILLILTGEKYFVFDPMTCRWLLRLNVDKAHIIDTW